MCSVDLVAGFFRTGGKFDHDRENLAGRCARRGEGGGGRRRAGNGVERRPATDQRGVVRENVVSVARKEAIAGRERADHRRWRRGADARRHSQHRSSRKAGWRADRHRRGRARRRVAGSRGGGAQERE